LTANPLASYGLPNEAFLPSLLAVLLLAIYVTYRLTRRTTTAEMLRILRSHGPVSASDRGSLVPQDLIQPGGVGVLGGGANACARALLVQLLTSAAEGPLTVVLTRNELYRLFEDGFGVTDLLEEVIEHLELHMLVSDGEQASPELGGRDRTPIYWIATPGNDDDVVRPLLRDNRIRGMMFGEWRHGPTYAVDPDGSVTHVSNRRSSSLKGGTLPVLTTVQALEALRSGTDARSHRPASSNTRPGLYAGRRGSER
jgi:hypothetical protein